MDVFIKVMYFYFIESFNDRIMLSDSRISTDFIG